MAQAQFISGPDVSVDGSPASYFRREFDVADGVDGMNFITQCVASSNEGGAWKPLKHPLCR
jgi:hypothetical protein